LIDLQALHRFLFSEKLHANQMSEFLNDKFLYKRTAFYKEFYKLIKLPIRRRLANVPDQIFGDKIIFRTKISHIYPTLKPLNVIK